jgi:hypothetical protein
MLLSLQKLNEIKNLATHISNYPSGLSRFCILYKNIRTLDPKYCYAIISKDVQSRPPAHLIVYSSYESVRF